MHIHTRPAIYQEANRLMRVESDRNERAAPLWPFVAILQMAFVKAVKDSTGGTLCRGRLISSAELDQVRRSLAAGGDGEIVLRGVTSCSRLENMAVKFARKAAASATMVRVLLSVSLKRAQ
jgi:hypothetical protein